MDADRGANMRLDIAANIRAERARKHMSQREISDGMRRFGYRWHHQTTGAVERGERPLLIDELLALAVILEVSPETLYGVQRQVHHVF